jgi:phage baseplate assembly protein gpV
MTGVYAHGVVVNNNDPLKAKRLQIRVDGPHDDIPDAKLPWAICGVYQGRGCHPTADRVEIPIIGAELLVVFQQGDSQNPMYLGGVASVDTVPDLFKPNYPHRSGWLVPNGTYFVVDEVANSLTIHHRGTTAVIDSGGNVQVNVVGTTTVVSAGNVLVQAPQVTLDTPMTICTGQLDVHAMLTFRGGMTGYGGGSGDTATITGTIRVSGGDVVVDGIGVKTHHHNAPNGATGQAIA